MNPLKLSVLVCAAVRHGLSWVLLDLSPDDKPESVTPRHLSESVHINVSPAVVYAAISDPTRMGEWSPESTGARVWTRGPSRVGTRFWGTNSNGRLRHWATECTVVVADVEADFAFEVRAAGALIARWGYELARSGGGTLVTETWTDLRHGLHGRILSATAPTFTGSKDRVARNRQTMRETLDNLKAALERQVL